MGVPCVHAVFEAAVILFEGGCQRIRAATTSDNRPTVERQGTMSKMLVIPDIHLKPWMFDLAEEALSQDPSIDRAIILGDLVDDWGRGIEAYKETVDAAVAFDGAHPGTLWCLGNHDFAYLHHDEGCRNSGFSEHLKYQVSHLLRGLCAQAGDRMRIAHVLDGTVFSHGGLSTAYVGRVCGKLDEERMPLEDVLEFTEGASASFLWEDDSPLWFRPDLWNRGIGGLRQVTGHTPVERPTMADDILMCDVFSTYPDGTPIGNRVLVAYDTETGEWAQAARARS